MIAADDLRSSPDRTYKVTSTLLSAISFISAVVGEAFVTSGKGVVTWTWQAKPGNCSIYLLTTPDTTGFRIHIDRAHIEDDPGVPAKLFAIIGWASYHGVPWEMP